MLILIGYERGKLIYTHCHSITSHKLGRCAVQNNKRVVAYEEVTAQQVPSSRFR